MMTLLMNKFRLLLVSAVLTNLINGCGPTSIKMDNKMDYKKEKQTINYEKIGSGENKILFIHGFGASRKSYYDIIPFFDETYELYLIDLIGFGESKPNLEFEFTQQNQAKVIYEFILENKLENLIVVGHSYGGGVTLILLQLIENAKKNSISKIILLDPASYPQKFPFFISISRTPILNKLFMWIVSENSQAKHVLKHLFWDDTKVTSERIERYAEHYKKDYNKLAIIKTAQKLIPDNFDEIQEKVKKLETPILIIWGDKDPVIPKENVLRLHSELVHSKLVILEDVGHIVHEEKPEEVFSEIMKFLTETKQCESL